MFVTTCSPCMHAQSLSCVPLFATPWSVALQAPLSMGFPRQGYWMPFPPPGDLPNPEIEPIPSVSPALQVDSLPTEPPGKPKIKWSETKKCSFSHLSAFCGAPFYCHLSESVQNPAIGLLLRELNFPHQMFPLPPLNCLQPLGHTYALAF